MFKKSLAVITTTLLLLGGTMPGIASAHGGSSRVTDDAVINILQTPISPLVGETVKSNYTFEDKANNRLKDLAVTFTLTKSALGDESKDQHMNTYHFTTDANGQIEFDYTFKEAGYFDADIDFDINNKSQSAGNLIQVRNKTLALPAALMAAVGGLLIGVSASGIVLKKTRHSKKHHDAQ